MNLINKHLDKNNLHHAYLIEGAREEIVPEILDFIKNLGIETSGNPDFCQISMDSFKMDEAKDLKDLGSQKGFSAGKKVFLICANSFSPDAQNAMLKMFEEPIENTHFFVVVPDTDSLLRTLVSRFYVIKPASSLEKEIKEAEKFINMPARARIDFIKELIAVPEEEDESTSPQPSPYQGEGVQDSARAKASKFLNALEVALHQKMTEPHPSPLLKEGEGASIFEQIFKAREFLRQPGSSAKTLMESVVLIVPNL